MKLFSEGLRFFRTALSSFQTTGAVLPSSRGLGRALASALTGERPPYRILEVGPGTGAVTAEILACLRDRDSFDIVELNKEFVNIVELRFASEPLFAKWRDSCRVHHQSLEETAGEHCYDVIISGLPLNNFPVDLVARVFEAYHRLLKPGGTLSYFEYALVRSLKAPFVGSAERERLAAVTSIVTDQITRYQIGKKLVLLNFPPAYARHLQLTSAPASRPEPV